MHARFIILTAVAALAVALPASASAAVYNGDPRNNTLTAIGGVINDRLDGRGGNDYLWADAGNDLLLGGPGDDDMNGNEGNDKLVGGFGADYMKGGADNDAMDGGPGKDEMNGDAGDDRMHGGDGDDFINGDNGADVLYLGFGKDSAWGGPEDESSDTIYSMANDRQVDTIDCGPGDDTAVVRPEDTTVNCEHVTIL